VGQNDSALNAGVTERHKYDYNFVQYIGVTWPVAGAGEQEKANARQHLFERKTRFFYCLLRWRGANKISGVKEG